MKISRYITVLLLFTGIFTISAQNNWVGIHSDQPSSAQTTLVSTSETGSVISVTINGFNLVPVSTPRGDAFTIAVDGATPLLEKGMPDLPKLATSVIIPDDAQMEVRVVSSEYIDYPFMEVAPSKGNFTRDIDPASVAYEYGRAYTRDEFFPSTQASLREPYILRDYRGQTILINPFAYNPVTKTLRVYYAMTVEISRVGTSTDNILVRDEAPQSIDAEF
ncbi:MAG: hypothetical protein CVU14_05190, partial [Bacteroidetes bacterium HGW-Bacteroidetes-9]